MATTGVSDLAGSVLAERYRLVAPIGTGASGRVYLADDTRLMRRVAVKVLHAALADDAGFLRRFRAEAQVAGSLQHPHIVTVHDWGEDSVPFMVLEYLAGGSLRAMLDEGNRLSPAQAARVGRDVASALDYAHTRGLVHRDIKPANLLFDEHGIVRVADFGLARALAEASWTEPSGAVLGTARYASPEQALGVPLDARSDLYSLALVLVEAVAGRLPFVADTTLGTLTARTQRSLLAPSELGPLGPVVERAGRLEPDERYPDAATMAEALADAVESLPRAAPLVLAGAHDRGDTDPTQARTAIAAERAAAAAAAGVAAGAAGAAAGPVVFDQDAQLDGAPAAARAEPVASDGGSAAPPPDAEHGRTLGRRLVGPVVALVVIAIAVAVAVSLTGASLGDPEVSVPGVVGRTADQAEALATRAGFDLRIDEEVSSDDPAGLVLSQRPASGRWLQEGGDLVVVVSKGPAPVKVPDVTAKPADEAAAALGAAGLLSERATDFDEEVDEGLVIRQDPAAGQELARESTVTITVSEGPAPREIPDLGGLSYEQAAARLADLGLDAQRTVAFSDTVPTGEVIGSDPAPGASVPRGADVTVVVSRGPQTVAVPNVVRQPVERASAALEAAGLQVRVERFAPGRPVASQSPAAGTKVRRGTTVTLTLGAAAPTPTTAAAGG